MKLAQVTFPDSNDSITARAQILVLRLIASALGNLPGGERAKPRMAMPEVAIELNDELANSNINDEVGLDDHKGFKLDTQFVKQGMRFLFKLIGGTARQILIGDSSPFRPLRKSLWVRFPPSLIIFQTIGLSHRVMVGHKAPSLGVHDSGDSLVGKPNTKFGRFAVNSTNAQPKSTRNRNGARRRIYLSQHLNALCCPDFAIQTLAFEAIYTQPAFGIAGFQILSARPANVLREVAFHARVVSVAAFNRAKSFCELVTSRRIGRETLSAMLAGSLCLQHGSSITQVSHYRTDETLTSRGRMTDNLSSSTANG